MDFINGFVKEQNLVWRPCMFVYV